jgi:hypothetical protein
MPGDRWPCFESVANATLAAARAASGHAVDPRDELPPMPVIGFLNLLIGRAAFEMARRMYPRDLIEYRRGAQIIAE